MNELSQRIEVLNENIDGEEKVGIIDLFTGQLVNSGYQWSQIRDIVVSSLRSTVKKIVEAKRKWRK